MLANEIWERAGSGLGLQKNKFWRLQQNVKSNFRPGNFRDQLSVTQLVPSGLLLKKYNLKTWFFLKLYSLFIYNFFLLKRHIFCFSKFLAFVCFYFLSSVDLILQYFCSLSLLQPYGFAMFQKPCLDTCFK